MSEIVTLELPEHVVRSAQAVAARTNRDRLWYVWRFRILSALAGRMLRF